MKIRPQVAKSPRRAAVAFCAVLATLSLLVPPSLLGAEDRLTDAQGRSLAAGEFGEGAVVLVFMASWSPRCRDVVERVNGLEDRWGSRARVVIVNFQEEPADMRRFLGDKRTSVEIYYDRDGAYSKEHAITFLPGLLVLQNGTVAFRGRLGRDPDTILSQILG